MSIDKLYKSKLISADEAVKKIKSGDRVVVSHAIANPRVLIDALLRNKNSFENVEIVHMIEFEESLYAQKENIDHFRHNAFFAAKATRKSIAEGIADYTPCYFSQIPMLFKKNIMPVDVAMVQISRPDKHGYCSLGVSADYTKSAMECGKIVIAEVNDKMPRTMGGAFVHISNIDYLVEVSYDLIEIKQPKITEIEKKIGENCASLIEDGSTLQLGIGSIPEAVLMFLVNKKDLGIHSELISDGVVELYNKGIINNKAKTIYKDKLVASFLMGTKKLYEFADDNPAIELLPVEIVNDPNIIRQNIKMVSINSCVQVDLMGQVVSESIGLTQISGVGGQVDFVRGATMSEGGKSIIALPSTASDGKISKITAFLDKGAAVTTSRNDVDYIVTEYGVARLKGKTLRERAMSLINIAHPKFRDELQKEYNNRFMRR